MSPLVGGQFTGVGLSVEVGDAGLTVDGSVAVVLGVLVVDATVTSVVRAGAAGEVLSVVVLVASVGVPVVTGSVASVDALLNSLGSVDGLCPSDPVVVRDEE